MPPPFFDASGPNVGARFSPRLAAIARSPRAAASSVGGEDGRPAEGENRLGEAVATRERCRACRSDMKSPEGAGGAGAGVTAGGGVAGAVGAGWLSAMTGGGGGGGAARGRGATAWGAECGTDSSRGAALSGGAGREAVGGLVGGANCTTSDRLDSPG